MPIPLEDHVRQVLLENNRASAIYTAVHDGWSSFEANYPSRHLWRRKSSSRAMVWEEIVRKLAAVSASDDGTKLIEHRDTVSLVIEDEILLRLKHANTALITQNFPTEEAQAYDDHEVDLFGFSGLQRVKLCYVLDEFESSLIWVGVTATHKGKLLWKIELKGEGAALAVSELPLVEIAHDTARLAKLKDDRVAKKQNKDQQ